MRGLLNSSLLWGLVALIMVSFSLPVSAGVGSNAGTFLQNLEQYYKNIPPSKVAMPDTPEAMNKWYHSLQMVEKDLASTIRSAPKLSKAETVKMEFIYYRIVTAKAGWSVSKSVANIVKNLSKDINYFRRCSDDLGIGYCKFYAPDTVQIIETSGKSPEYYFYPDEMVSAKKLILLIHEKQNGGGK